MARQSRLPESEAPSDDHLIALTARGDADALTALFRRYGDLVFTTAYRCLGSELDAEDVLQDLFVGLPEALHGYEHRGQFPAWLKGVAVRMSLMMVRSSSRRREDSLDLEEHQSISAHAPPDIVDRLAARRAIATLPDTLRLVFMLKEIEGYSHAEIAVLVGISAGASAARLTRAWRQVREIFNEK